MNEAAGESSRPPVKLVGAVVSALDIMRFLAQADEPLRLAQISRSLGLNNSTCFNILRTLELEGIVEFDRLSKLYRAGTCRPCHATYRARRWQTAFPAGHGSRRP